MRRAMTCKRLAAFGAAVIMAAGAVTGCGGKKEETTATTAGGGAATASTEAGGVSEAGSFTDYSAGFPENVTIKIPVYDRGFEGWDPANNYYTKWIQKEFGDKYNVTLNYVGINRQNEVTDYMQMIAAGNAPDIIFHYDMPQAVNYNGEGAMQELNLDEIQYYAPAYYDKLGDTIKKYGQLDGKNTFFFAGRNAIYYNYVHLIRQDWLNKVGMEKPTTREELDAVMAAWKEAGLGTRGDYLINKSYTYEYPFIGSDPDKNELALYLDLNVAPLTWQATKDYLVTMNKEFNEGILDPEFYLNTDDAAWKADFVAGNVGTYSFYIAANTDVISSLKANDPNAEVSVMSPKALAPAGSQPYYYEYPPYGMVMGINSTASDMQRAAIWMFLDWMIQPENLFFLQNGMEGVNYTLNEEGIAVPVPDFAGESKLSNNNNKDYWCLVAEVADYGDETKNFKANLKTLAPAGYEQLVQNAYDYDKEIKEYGIISPIFTKSIEATNEYKADLTAMWQEFYVDMVTCKPEELEAKYDAYCKEYLDNGYQEILDEKQALIDAGDYIK
ncbi:extracellular solute-binding protein [Lacrimispora indolis]|uniref:extracellular solute-binding protein n=1 Tax=Lacrimispora indolis TaxID=69825 RepID=UPI0004B8B321|nr:extracellular solute-binding protein [Lacrimispora indolis]MBE7722460.1 ABC transporter substrate-binding protein [Lacrimispora celerecrescens]